MKWNKWFTIAAVAVGLYVAYTYWYLPNQVTATS